MRKVASSGGQYRGILGWFLAVSLTCSSLAVPARSGDFEWGFKTYQRGDYAGAYTFFYKALEKDPYNVNLLYYLADCLAKTGRKPEARTEYYKVIMLSPRSQAAKLARKGLDLLENKVKTSDNSQLAGAGRSQAARRDGADKPLSPFEPIAKGYIKYASNAGEYGRWSPVGMPLRLFIDEHPEGVRNFLPAFPSLVKKSLEAWVIALDEKISYEIVNTPADADIRVSWVNTIDNQGFSTEAGTTFTAGLTLPELNRAEKKLLQMHVKLATFDIEKKPMTQQEVYSVALHEMGHALGILGHSLEEGDAMYPNTQVSKLSPNDIQTVRLLYSMPVDVTNLGPTPKDDKASSGNNGEQVSGTDLVLDRLNEEISLAEQVLVKSPTAMNHQSLGITLYNKFKYLKKKAGTLSEEEQKELLKEMPELFRKSEEAIDKAISVDPRFGYGHYNRSLLHQETGNLEAALQSIEQGVRYESDPKLLLEKTKILAKMGRASDARGALQQFIEKSPHGAGNSEEVQIIRQMIEQRSK